jgi:Ca2+/H+ antiporter, TMEM165/GDT1 family
MIVLTLGTSSVRLGLAAAGAATAALVVVLAGLVLARRLVEVPENTLKMVVGIMLVSFGTFWSGEGLGVDWPGTDLSILGLIGVYGAVTFWLVTSLRRARRPAAADPGRRPEAAEVS